MYDLIIKNGKIIDGTGSPAYRADLAVSNGKIVRIDRGITGGKKVIDAAGLVVTPGFIDSHSHADLGLLAYPEQTQKIQQGITTSIGGQCGFSRAPLSRDADPSVPIGTYGTKGEVLGTMGRFLDTVKDIPLGANSAVFVGHDAIRRAVMGAENRAPSTEELERMKQLLRDGIEHGAMGVSFGLTYPSSGYAKIDELIELAKVAAENNALVAAHIRDEGDQLVRSTAEFLSILKASGARGIHSHHKAMGNNNWGKVSHTLRMMDQANEEGVDVYCDVYPYCASNTDLIDRFIPQELHSEGAESILKLLESPQKREELRQRNIDKWGEDLSWVLITRSKLFPDHPDKRIPELAALCGKDPYDVVFDLIQSQPTITGNYFMVCEEDLELVMAHPRAMICTDAGVSAPNSAVAHPRMVGSFPRVLGRYVRERKVVSLPEMIRKMTAMPAAVYGLTGKGLLAEGFDADICIFDPDTIIDRATFSERTLKAEGLNYVLLGGEVVVEDAVFNGKCMGKLLLRRR